jgi:hypothetical protein
MDDSDTQLAREVAEAELAHAAERFALVTSMVRQGDTSQEMLSSARTALHAAAVAYCQAHGHADSP